MHQTFITTPPTPLGNKQGHWLFIYHSPAKGIALWGQAESHCPAIAQPIDSFSKYWAKPKFWHQLRVITLAVIKLPKLSRNNSKIDLASIYANAKFGQNPSVRSQDIEQNKNSDINQCKGYHCINVKFSLNPSNHSKWRYERKQKFWHQSRAINLQKCKNSNLDLVNINAHAKYGQNSSISYQDIERKQSSDVN